MLVHLPHGTIRPPQAAALSAKIGNKAGGTEGRGPSLHMDASASILRPLSPYGPDFTLVKLCNAIAGKFPYI